MRHVEGAERSARRRWRHRWRHSLRARLITVFLLLAIAMAAVFIGGVQRALSTGWRDAARPIVADYMDRLVAEIGSPPDVDKARTLVARLPLAVRISGPTVNWDSQPERSARRGPGGMERDWLTRSTADGHRITFGLGTLPWQREPGGIGWLTLGLLLALIVAAYAYVRRLLRPLDDIRAGAERFGRGAFHEPIPLRRRDELGDLAHRINTMAHDIEGMLDAKRGLLLALSHELRSPLTRARLNAELLPDTPESARERDALLRDLNEMRDLISDLLESERLASPHAALPGGETVTLDLASARAHGRWHAVAG
ncbi:MAG: HAMP domain-containing protein, partial [Variovorax sp.]